MVRCRQIVGLGGLNEEDMQHEHISGRQRLNRPNAQQLERFVILEHPDKAGVRDAVDAPGVMRAEYFHIPRLNEPGVCLRRKQLAQQGLGPLLRTLSSARRVPSVAARRSCHAYSLHYPPTTRGIRMI